MAKAKPETAAIPEGFKPVLAWTEYRIVFAGLVPVDTDLSARCFGLKQARMAIRWNTGGGIAELASIGPNSGTRVGTVADIPALHGMIFVGDVTPEAWEKWCAA